MGVSRLTGMNSEAMSVATQSVNAKTAPQCRPSWLEVWLLRCLRCSYWSLYLLRSARPASLFVAGRAVL